MSYVLLVLAHFLTLDAPGSGQKWDNVLSRLPLSSTDPWTSLVLTGSLAIIEPEEAYRRCGAKKSWCAQQF